MDEIQIAELAKLIEESKMPDWWKSYASQLSYNLQVHTKGLMFDKITGLYPNEHPESQKHCINSYESITKGSVWKAINNIIRVFNNSSYNIQISEKTQKTLEAYESNEGSFFSQFLEDWIRRAISEDPNGICVVYPPEYTDDLYRYVGFKDLIKVSDEVLIFISEEESKYKIEVIDNQYAKEVFFDYEHLDGQPNVRHTTVKTFNRRLEKNYTDFVYHVFTKTHFIRFWKEEGESQFSYKFYKHNIGSIPYFENGGVEVEDNIYESFIQPFIPFGNLALIAHRNQRAVELMFYYPRMSEVQSPCDDCHGSGRVTCDTGMETCKTCHGSKFVTVQSPYKVYRKTSDSFDTDGKVFSTPSVEFYSPDTGILTLVQKQWLGYLEQAEEAVFIQKKTDTGNVEAAKSKQLDQEGLFSWLSNISKVFFNNLEIFLQYLEKYNGTSMQVSVERPYSFAILTESEAFETMATLLSSNAPVLLKASQIDNFVNKFVSDSSPVKRALQILKKYDLLLYYGIDDVSNLKGQGTVSPLMVQQHTLAYPALIKLYESDKTLFELEDDQIIKKLSAELDKYDMTKDLKASLLGLASEGNSLKDSVGGLTGMIEIAKAVASGLYDLDAAIALVSDRFGITEDEARRQLGTPTISNDPKVIDKVQTLTA